MGIGKKSLQGTIAGGWLGATIGSGIGLFSSLTVELKELEKNGQIKGSYSSAVFRVLKRSAAITAVGAALGSTTGAAAGASTALFQKLSEDE